MFMVHTTFESSSFVSEQRPVYVSGTASALQHHMKWHICTCIWLAGLL